MTPLELTPLYTDFYQLTMGQVYFLNQQHQDYAVFDYFFRRLPFHGGYVVSAGLQDLLKTIAELRFTTKELSYLRGVGLNVDFVDYLEGFRFKGDVYAVQEGDVVFPGVPSMRVEGSMIETQIIETLLLNFINFQSLIATKASRIRQVAPGKILADFGLRRAQGLGGYHATRSAIIGGFDSTSNVKAAHDFQTAVSGTMAHSFVQHYGDELAAFRAFAEGRPEHCVLLVDTYDTLRSGIPNAIVVGKEMEKKGHRLEAIRLDSGDLAYLSKKARKMLDDAGLTYVRIAASNQLDEHVIKSLQEQGAPIDVYGVGTNMVTGHPDAALDGVYKLCYSNGNSRIKLSESISKTTLPNKKQVFRAFDTNGEFWGADVITLHDEGGVEVMHHPVEPDSSVSLKGLKLEPLLFKVMQGGNVTAKTRSLKEISDYRQHRLSLLPDEYKRFENPHVYKVGISPRLKTERDALRKKFLERDDSKHTER